MFTVMQLFINLQPFGAIFVRFAKEYFAIYVLHSTQLKDKAK